MPNRTTCLLVIAGCCVGCATEDSANHVDTTMENTPLLQPLEWGECDTAVWPDGYPKPVPGVECTVVAVPLDWENPAGTSIDLRVARHRSRAFPTGNAAFQLAGGPGGSSVAQSGLIPRFFSRLRDTFDLVYVDQRGTGGSGYIGCAGGYPYSKDEWIACALEHANEPLDYYQTLSAARDLDFVRQRLGYERIYMRGGSYGTRLALEYLRQFEANVQAVVLDGLAPPDFDYPASVITQADLGVGWLIAECSAAPECLQVSPHLADDMASWRQAVARSPRPILMNGSPYQEDEALFLMALTPMMDWADMRYQMPRAIHQAVLGDTTLWNRLLSATFGVTITNAAGGNTGPKSVASASTQVRPVHRRGWVGQSYVAPGLYAAVSCAEWVPNRTWEQALALHEEQVWDDGYMLGFMEACQHWQVTQLPPTMRQPVVSSAKALLLSGGIDIITPPAEADRALLTLANGTHLVVPHMTHSTMSIPCVSDIITSFLVNAGDMAAVDTSCLAAQGHPAW